MTNNNRSRKGSLQFYPRVRAKKVLPSINWAPHSKEGTSLLGFVGYKVGMLSASVKDNTPDSMTNTKRKIIPVTVLECPTMKIYSVRYYKDGKVLKDVIVTNDKDLKKKVKVPKVAKYLGDAIQDFDDVRVVCYTQVKETSVGKKKPDMIEIGLSGNNEEKVTWVKEHINKAISVTQVMQNGLVDIHAVTKGYGTQGTVKRFGVHLKDHKSEKGQRRPGSLSAFGLRRVTFRAPMAGQTGYHNRVNYNSQIIQVGKIAEQDISPKSGFHKYGNVKTEYVLIRGSVPGPKKRGVVLTTAQRPTRRQVKQSYEVIELR